MKAISTYTRTNYETHTSSDGDKWWRSSTFAATPEGYKEAQVEIKKLSNRPFVRIAHVTRTVKVVKNVVNKSVLTDPEIKQLMAAGAAAVKEVAGVTVSEGFDISFGSTIEHGPTKIRVSFNPAVVIGPSPRRVNLGPQSKEALQDWDNKAVTARDAALDRCCELLNAAKISFVRTSYDIQLRRSSAK